MKVIFLWNPLVAYTVPEINAFKQFAADGGRLVFVGEWDGYYGAGIALENAFLLNMGAVMTNIGQAIDCGYNTLPAASLRPHEVTTGMTGVTIACASVIVPGPTDFPLYYDLSNTKLSRWRRDDRPDADPSRHGRQGDFPRQPRPKHQAESGFVHGVLTGESVRGTPDCAFPGSPLHLIG